MSAQLPPMHPYSVMLYRISVFLKADMEKVYALGRIMGCRDLQGVTNPWMLFEKLENMGYLSEFKLSDLKKALDLIGLSEAGLIVKEYEDKDLKGKPNAKAGGRQPSQRNAPATSPILPPPPPYSFKDVADENHNTGQEDVSHQHSGCAKPLTSQDWTTETDIPSTPVSTDTQQTTRPMFKRTFIEEPSKLSTTLTSPKRILNNPGKPGGYLMNGVHYNAGIRKKHWVKGGITADEELFEQTLQSRSHVAKDF